MGEVLKNLKVEAWISGAVDEEGDRVQNVGVEMEDEDTKGLSGEEWADNFPFWDIYLGLCF